MRWSRSRAATAAGAGIAAVATAGSLYLSLWLGLVPCELCWYQRILMYPLVIVLGVAAAEHRLAHRTALLLALPGAVLAAYHSMLQATATGCGFDGACAAVQIRLFGLTVPNLSLVAFLLVAGTAVAARLVASGDAPGSTAPSR